MLASVAKGSARGFFSGQRVVDLLHDA
jgi:hypothetical protein